ncbi:hypothetical protein D3C71_1843710 [compost metagenome]
MRQDGAGADGVDANGGGERLRHGLGRGPEHGLRESVAEIGRAGVENPFVDHVDDISLDADGKLAGKVA